MNKPAIFLLLALFAITVAAACDKQSPSGPSPREPVSLEVITVCRDDSDPAVLEVIKDMYNRGFQYEGVLNANGINCNRVLFRK